MANGASSIVIHKYGRGAISHGVVVLVANNQLQVRDGRHPLVVLHPDGNAVLLLLLSVKGDEGVQIVLSSRPNFHHKLLLEIFRGFSIQGELERWAIGISVI